MILKDVIWCMIIYGIGNLIVWFQLNGQFKWEWFAKHEWVMALCGIPMSFLYIWGTKYTVEGMDNLLWPTRFIGFGIGIIVYAIMVNYIFSEEFSIKTIISILLSVILICIQAFWK